MNVRAHADDSLPAATDEIAPPDIDGHVRILVVHTASAVAEASRFVADLEDLGYDAVPLRLSRTVVDAVLADDPDLVIIARTDDSFDLVRVCRALHGAIRCRILIVGGPEESDAEALVIDALEAGADDYIAATASPRVVIARVRAALRARPVRRRRARTIEVGDVVIDLDAHSVLVGGKPVNCPPRQFDVLVALASQPGQMVLRDSLISTVWGVAATSVNPRRVRIAISLLRGVLGTGPRRPVIESVSRMGYRLVVPPATPL